MRLMIPLTTMPAGAKGESDPALAPLPTMMAMRNIGTAARPATAIAIGATSAALAILPGPSDDSALVTQKQHDRHEADIAAADLDGPVRDLVERAIQLRLGEEQRHAREREKESDRKAAEDGGERHAREIHADDPRERERQDSHVQLAEATDDDGDNERAE